MNEIIPQYAICIANNGYPASLELHKVYRLIPDEAAALDGDVRVIDESGEDYLYPADYFVFITVPKEKAQLLWESFVPYSA
ncbi:MAG: hypothetical protein KF770_01480 [Anaerolineae bacterium]|nr:hypothetical protein [Anaerolineae bacterium]